ncbi:helix-turn-helix domain-containing protein [Bacillus gaemokensis]|uniref:DNA-binding protein n=1 Tax=Bacillus gaemokensis TaxID=574375 RepID=A0A073K5A4_9BACI|nr:helix-turn-helix domain-containing protein [Bacillus gaemokensis]KEK21741.1 DNA-binding protein [Bacillus gaemokensis]KYG37820.1 DNA-binding protein [Bacillus gaemokensis]
MSWFSKPRSKLGKFLDRNDIKQINLAQYSGVSEGTISKLCRADTFYPSLRNGQKIIKALKKMTHKDIQYDDFWV